VRLFFLFFLFHTMTPEYKNPTLVKSYFASIKITSLAVNQKFNFLDLPQLRNAFVYAIETYTASSITIAPDGTTIVPIATGINFTLIDRNTRNEFIRQCPALSFNRNANNGRLFTFKARQIDWQSSGISLSSIAGLAVNQSIGFNIYYMDDKPQSKPNATRRRN